MKNDAYLALFRALPLNKWLVTFPDLPGCKARGENLEEAHIAASRALANHLEELDGPVPPPRSTRELIENARGDWLLCRQFTDALLRPVIPASDRESAQLRPAEPEATCFGLTETSMPPSASAMK